MRFEGKFNEFINRSITEQPQQKGDTIVDTLNQLHNETHCDVSRMLECEVPNASWLSGCWRLTLHPTMSSLITTYYNTADTLENYPLIQTYLQYRWILPYCRYIIPLATWYECVRRRFQGVVTHEAEDWTHQQAIEEMEKRGESNARKYFNEFREAWNTIRHNQQFIFGGIAHREDGSEAHDEEAPWGRFQCEILDSQIQKLSYHSLFGLSLLSQSGMGSTLYMMFDRLTSIQNGFLDTVLEQCHTGSPAHAAVCHGESQEVIIPCLTFTSVRQYQVISDVPPCNWLDYAYAHTAGGQGHRILVDWRGLEDLFLRSTFVGKVRFIEVNPETCGFRFRQEEGESFIEICSQLHHRYCEFCSEIPPERVAVILSCSDFQASVQDIRGIVEVLISQIRLQLLTTDNEDIQKTFREKKLIDLCQESSAQSASLLQRSRCGDLAISRIFSLLDLVYDQLIHQDARHIPNLTQNFRESLQPLIRTGSLNPHLLMYAIRRFYVTHFNIYRSQKDTPLTDYLGYLNDCYWPDLATPDDVGLPSEVTLGDMIPLYVWFQQLEQTNN